MKTALRGVIFDMDGTLTVPAIDFAGMRRRLEISESDILATIKTWPHDRRKQALAIIEEFEEVARQNLEIQVGAVELLEFLDAHGLYKGLMTRNTAKTVRHLVRCLGHEFAAVLTRDFEPVKPAPEPALHICRQWNIKPGETLVVGDYRDDILCGKAAGTRTCLLVNEHNRAYATLADYAASDLYQVRELIQVLLTDGRA